MTISYSTTPKFAKSYFVHLCNCMGLKDGRVYDKNFIFENEHLLTLTPEDVVCYFNLKVFGTPNPSEDSCPKFGRSSSLCFYKKAISFFMPNKLLGWNVQIMSGNPTKSVIVNEVINKVKKMEVRRQGKSSQARQALTIEEFKFMISMMRKSEDPMKKIAVPALCSFQFHLIVRIDDTCQFMLNELCAHDLFPFALHGRMMVNVSTGCIIQVLKSICPGPSRRQLQRDISTRLSKNVGETAEERKYRILFDNMMEQMFCIMMNAKKGSTEKRVLKAILSKTMKRRIVQSYCTKFGCGDITRGKSKLQSNEDYDNLLHGYAIDCSRKTRSTHVTEQMIKDAVSFILHKDHVVTISWGDKNFQLGADESITLPRLCCKVPPKHIWE